MCLHMLPKLVSWLSKSLSTITQETIMTARTRAWFEKKATFTHEWQLQGLLACRAPLSLPHYAAKAQTITLDPHLPNCSR
eukprot:1147678-Pelagomonas_calceolata.AAC.6